MLLFRNITETICKWFLYYLSGMIRTLLLLSVLQSSTVLAQTNPVYIIGETTGPLVFLNYGLGEDRLGGAKMTYLDSNIVVKVTDSVKNNYKIQLSKNHFAYLPKVNFKRNDSIVNRPYYLTESWKVYGDDNYDYVTIPLDGRLPYRSIQEINPARIVVDIFGATSNTNWITQSFNN